MKSGSHRWRWVAIAAVTLSAIIGWLVIDRSRVDQPSDVEPVRADSDGVDPVGRYMEFAAGLGDSQSQAPDGIDLIVEGLRLLAGALGTLGLVTPDLQVDLRVAAEHLRLNPGSTATTEAIRAALVRAAAAVQKADGRAQNELSSAATAIDPMRPLLDQAPTMRAFFRQAANAMRQPRPDGRQST